jgi:hypothetical protein
MQASGTKGDGPIMAVSAHPDDVEFTSGGSLARWAAQGWNVHLVLCNDGEKGGSRAGYGEGGFYDPEAATVSLRAPARRWHLLKVLIEEYWLRRWFVAGPAGLHTIGDRILFG